MKNKNVKIVMWGDVLGEWRLFQNPVKILIAWKPEDVLSTLLSVQDAVDSGLYATGFISYEASAGIGKVYETHKLLNMPLVWFGLFRSMEDIKLQNESKPFNIGIWEPSVSREEYSDAIKKIKKYLKDGDTYQVNYTFRLMSEYTGDPWNLFLRLQKTQNAKYCSFIDTESFSLCSASPELFFSMDGDEIISRPMKGTSKRGLTFEEDKVLADILKNSDKNKAENVMIVDMIRNDMGKIALQGTVEVLKPFEIEQYPTVFQMTSTVACRTSDASLCDIIKALFPCASITGAPKVRTMQIIKEVENTPRGVYTGCIGYIQPGRKAEFNVAIRTVCMNKQNGTAEYGVGGAIVWDSELESEYDECRIKSAILTVNTPDFQLLESILWEKETGYFLLGKHLKRLRCSAEYFGFALNIDNIRTALMMYIEDNNICRRSKIRLLVTKEGNINIACQPLENIEGEKLWKISLSENTIDSNNMFLYHKTTNRVVYDSAREFINGVDDILLINDKGEITETTIANIVIEKGGEKITPPVSCGLLPGVFREYLLECGEIKEGVITLDTLRESNKIFMVNSVRKWIKAKFI